MHRSEYMKACGTEALSAAHRAYYGQYVDDKVCQIVRRNIGLAALVWSNKESFNDIPLDRWDALVPQLGKDIDKQLRENGDWLSIGTGVCILKEAGRQILEDVPATEGGVCK